VGRNYQIIGTTHPQAGNAELFWFAVGGGANKYAELAPNGIAPNPVMAEEHHNIVLVTASGRPTSSGTTTASGSAGNRVSPPRAGKKRLGRPPGV
jgi:hypothetical protein